MKEAINYIGELVIDPERGLGVIIGEDRDSVVVAFKDKTVEPVTLKKSEIEQSFSRLNGPLPPPEPVKGPLYPLSKLVDDYKSAHPNLRESETKKAIYALLARLAGRAEKRPKTIEPGRKGRRPTHRVTDPAHEQNATEEK